MICMRRTTSLCTSAMKLWRSSVHNTTTTHTSTQPTHRLAPTTEEDFFPMDKSITNPRYRWCLVLAWAQLLGCVLCVIQIKRKSPSRGTPHAAGKRPIHVAASAAGTNKTSGNTSGGASNADAHSEKLFLKQHTVPLEIGALRCFGCTCQRRELASRYQLGITLCMLRECLTGFTRH